MDYVSIMEKKRVNTINDMRISPRYLTLKEASCRKYDSVYVLVHIHMYISLKFLKLMECVRTHLTSVTSEEQNWWLNKTSHFIPLNR